MTLLAQLPYPASQHGLHNPQRSAGFQMAVPKIQYQRSRITFENNKKQTTKQTQQTPHRQSLSPIGVSGFIRPLQCLSLRQCGGYSKTCHKSSKTYSIRPSICALI